MLLWSDTHIYRVYNAVKRIQSIAYAVNKSDVYECMTRIARVAYGFLFNIISISFRTHHIHQVHRYQHRIWWTRKRKWRWRRRRRRKQIITVANIILHHNIFLLMLRCARSFFSFFSFSLSSRCSARVQEENEELRREEEKKKKIIRSGSMLPFCFTERTNWVQQHMQTHRLDGF